MARLAPGGYFDTSLSAIEWLRVVVIRGSVMDILGAVPLGPE